MTRTIFITITVFLLFSVLYISTPSTIYASAHTLITEQELSATGFSGYESVNTNLLIYPIKQIIEKIEFSLLSNEKDKEKYKYKLLDKRFKELVFIINFQKTSFLEEAVGRYNSHLGNLMINNKDSALNYKNTLSGYINVLKNLQDRYDNISSYRLLIQQAIDTTRRLI